MATIALNAISGTASVIRPKPVVEMLERNMAAVGVPLSWSVFPIGTLKLAGAAGLVASLLGVPAVGTAAAAGLVLFWVCATYTHVRVYDWSGIVPSSCFFLPLAAGSLAVTL